MRSDRRWGLRASRPSCRQAGGTRITRPSACGGRATSLALFIRGGEGNPHDVLLANLLQRDRAAVATSDAPCSWAFNDGICEAQFSALGGSPTVSGGFFYGTDEAIDHRDKGQIMLEWGQRILKVADQRHSAIRTRLSGSDKADSVNFAGGSKVLIF